MNEETVDYHKNVFFKHLLWMNKQEEEENATPTQSSAE